LLNYSELISISMRATVGVSSGSLLYMSEWKQWRSGKGVARGAIPLNFELSESRNLLLVRKFSPKMRNLRLKTPILGKVRGEIEILSSHNLLYGKFAAVCRKNCNFLPRLLF